MKALYYTYPWAFDVPGGGERQLAAYRDHLAPHGISADLYDQWNPCFDDYTLFHCFSVMPGILEMCDYAKKRGLALVVSPNLWITPATVKSYPMQHIWNMFELADCVVTNSETEGDMFSELFAMKREKFFTVYNGVEKDFMYPVDPAIFLTRFNQQRPYVLNVANVEPRKNQLRLVDAMRSFPELDLLIVGHVRDEDYANQCIAMAAGNVRMLGPLPYNSELLKSAYAGSSLFAMPSMLETPSIAALEAAACGARILITTEGSTREYFNETVTYVDPTSVSSMIDGIRVALHLGAAESAWVTHDRFLWDKCVPEVAECYATVMREKAKGGSS